MKMKRNSLEKSEDKTTSDTSVAKRSKRNPELRIDDEGMPVPRKDIIPNAVDRFRENNEIEHIIKSGQSSSQCDIESYIDSTPKLKDELDKKQNISKPTINEPQQQFGRMGCATQTFITERDWADPNCIMCSERERMKRLSRRSTRRQPRPRQSRQRERRTRNPRISHRRRRNRRPPRRISMISREDRNSTEPVSEEQAPSEGSRHGSSISSYKSFYSLTHEPMD